MILCLQSADLSMTFWLFGCLKENVIGQYILIQVTDNSKEPTASFLIHLTYQPSSVQNSPKYEAGFICNVSLPVMSHSGHPLLLEPLISLPSSSTHQQSQPVVHCTG